MSSRRRRGGAAHDEGSEPDERWMASYMDMITVLMCLFVVLYAMSTVDEAKYAQLKDSLATGFGITSTKTVDSAVGVIVSPDHADSTSTDFAVPGSAAPAATPLDTTAPDTTALELARREVESLEKIRAAIDSRLTEMGLQGAVRFTIDERGLTVALVGSSTYFAGNSAALQAGARPIIDAIGAVVVPTPNQLTVEGNAAAYGSATPYATVWELSAARATTVLRHLVENDGVAPNRIWSTAYGSSRPITEGSSEQQLALNRRVDIVVLSAQTEEVRALIPQVLAVP